MGKDNSNKMTKTQYRTLVDETLSISLKKQAENDTLIWQSIVNQIKDIKKEVIDNQRLKGWDDINDRYTLGMIAVHEFDDDDEMQTRLCDIFSGAIEYHSMPGE